MNTRLNKLFAILLAAIVAMLLVTNATADPIDGRDILKFSQEPMIATPITDSAGSTITYLGHDELSTAYGFGDATGQIPMYQGRFMADDFADRFNSPVVHVKWWGSYFRDFINPEMPVNQFLISFEEDIPADATGGFSRPGTPLLNQVVRLDADGVLKLGEGTYTERLIRGPDTILNESLYEYNAELHLDKPFPQKSDTVYWLKIAALVDVPPGITFDPFNPSEADQITRWGWHNRDYTINNPLASVAPAVLPGEERVGTFGPGADIWHFQDDAVQGDLQVFPTPGMGFLMPDIEQFNMSPTRYLDFIDGPQGISSYSKDLAFELYTVPEPGSGLLALIGTFATAAVLRWRWG